MGVTDLIKALTDYLDVGKRVVNTVPGLVMACAFVMLLSSPPDYFQSGFLLNATADARGRVSQARAELGELNRQKALADGEKAYATEELTAAKLCNSATPAKNCPAKPADLRALFLEEAQRIGQQAVIQSQVDAKTGQLTAWQTELADWVARVRNSEDFQKFINSGVTAWLLFGLLGMAIGTVLDPLNKALFLQWLPTLAGDRGLATDNGRLTRMVRPAKHNFRGETDRPIQFYIGSGVVTQAEYDGLVSDYYRWSEISIGMILPIVALALGLLQWWRRGHGTWPPWWLSATAIGLALILGACLFIVGLRRYREFQLQVNVFIAGRLDQRKQQLEAQKTKVDLSALNQLVYEAKQLVAKLHPKPSGP